MEGKNNPSIRSELPVTVVNLMKKTNQKLGVQTRFDQLSNDNQLLVSVGVRLFSVLLLLQSMYLLALFTVGSVILSALTLLLCLTGHNASKQISRYAKMSR